MINDIRLALSRFSCANIYYTFELKPVDFESYNLKISLLNGRGEDSTAELKKFLTLKLGRNFTHIRGGSGKEWSTTILLNHRAKNRDTIGALESFVYKAIHYSASVPLLC